MTSSRITCIAVEFRKKPQITCHCFHSYCYIISVDNGFILSNDVGDGAAGVRVAGITAWRGRYCAFNYDAFEHFMRYVLAQVTSHPVPEPDPWDPDITSLLRMLCLSDYVSSFRRSIHAECISLSREALSKRE